MAKETRKLNVVIEYETDTKKDAIVEQELDAAIMNFLEKVGKQVTPKSLWVNGLPKWGVCTEPKKRSGNKHWSDFDIWNNAPRKVQCIRNDDNSGWWGDSKHELKVGEIYECINVEVHDNYTLVTLKGIDHPFNSVLFSEV